MYIQRPSEVKYNLPDFPLFHCLYTSGMCDREHNIWLHSKWIVGHRFVLFETRDFKNSLTGHHENSTWVSPREILWNYYFFLGTLLLNPAYFSSLYKLPSHHLRIALNLFLNAVNDRYRKKAIELLPPRSQKKKKTVLYCWVTTAYR